MENWEKKERTVTMTNDDWVKLTTYILITTKHRKNEQNAWEELATEKNEDGTLKFKNASSNATYYKELDADLERIRKIIDKA